MPGLNDIGESQWRVKVGKGEISGGGLSSDDLLYLMDRFPVVKALLTSDATVLPEKLTPEAMMKMLPDAVYAGFAIATGEPRGDQKAEANARKLALVVQLRMLKNIIDATIGEEGVGPFVAMMNAMNKSITIQQEDPEASANESPGQSPAALVLDLPPERRGRLRRAS